MKFNIITTLIALGICGLIAFGFYSFNQSENKMLLSGGCFAFLALTLVATIGINFELPRTTTNIRTVSIIFFLLGLISNLIFSFIAFAMPVYVMVNGILILLYLLICYLINRARQ